MMKPENLKISLAEVAARRALILIDVEEIPQFENQKPTGVMLGTKYTCVAPDQSYSSFKIKVEGQKPVITAEQLAAAGGEVCVKPINFEGRFFKPNKDAEYIFFAKATGMEIIQK